MNSTTDVIITDSWPQGYENTLWSLNANQLAAMGDPKLIATPPFHIGQEIAMDPLSYKGFMGYLQKMDLLPVQKAILKTGKLPRDTDGRIPCPMVITFRPQDQLR